MKKKIIKWFNEAKVRLFLQAWTITISFYEEKSNTLMRVSCLPHYVDARVEVNMLACSQYDDTTVRQAVYHECVHILMSDFSKYASKRHITKKQLQEAEERLAQIIAKVAQ